MTIRTARSLVRGGNIGRLAWLRLEDRPADPDLGCALRDRDLGCLRVVAVARHDKRLEYWAKPATMVFLPLLLGLPHLYPWAQPIPADDRIGQWQAIWSNTPFYIIRIVLSFAIWMASRRKSVSSSSGGCRVSYFRLWSITSNS